MNPLLIRLTSDIPLMLDDRLLALASLTAADVQAAAHPAIGKMKAALAPSYTITNGVAVLPIIGALMQNPDPWSMAFGDAEDLGLLTEQVQKATADSEATAIVLRIDSPGGMMTGGIELADAVTAASKAKPVVAFTDSLCASLGYLVASQADEIVATRSAQVGSIGTILTVADWSKVYDAMGVKLHTFTNAEGTLKTLTPMNEERAAYLQGRADKAFAMFRNRVTAKRPDVKPDVMKGQLFTGEEGKRIGLVDRLGDLGFAVSVARNSARARGRSGG
jgi:capsid assembly protease